MPHPASPTSLLTLAAMTALAPSPENGPKRTVHGSLVKVLTHRRDDRGMTLEPFASRCVRRGEVHELVTTDHTDTAPGARIDRVGFLGFAEIGCAGVLDRGDTVWAAGRAIGTVLGFDACHFPNHYNILIAAPSPVTGPQLALRPETEIHFTTPAAAGATGAAAAALVPNPSPSPNPVPRASPSP